MQHKNAWVRTLSAYAKHLILNWKICDDVRLCSSCGGADTAICRVKKSAADKLFRHHEDGTEMEIINFCSQIMRIIFESEFADQNATIRIIWQFQSGLLLMTTPVRRANMYFLNSVFVSFSTTTNKPGALPSVSIPQMCLWWVCGRVHIPAFQYQVLKEALIARNTYCLMQLIVDTAVGKLVSESKGAFTFMRVLGYDDVYMLTVSVDNQARWNKRLGWRQTLAPNQWWSTHSIIWSNVHRRGSGCSRSGLMTCVFHCGAASLSRSLAEGV